MAIVIISRLSSSSVSNSVTVVVYYLDVAQAIACDAEAGPAQSLLGTALQQSCSQLTHLVVTVMAVVIRNITTLPLSAVRLVFRVVSIMSIIDSGKTIGFKFVLPL